MPDEKQALSKLVTAYVNFKEAGAGVLTPAKEKGKGQGSERKETEER